MGIAMEAFDALWKQRAKLGNPSEEEIRAVLEEHGGHGGQARLTLKMRAEQMTVGQAQRRPVGETRPVTQETSKRTEESFVTTAGPLSALYELHESLGGGIQGQVYRVTKKAAAAHRPAEMVDQYAAKQLKCPSQDSEEWEAIRREIAALSQVAHPGVVSLHACVEDGAHLWIVMDFVRGVTLKDFVATRGALPEAHAAALVVGTAQALSHVHELRLMHRDIKPANIMFKDALVAHPVLIDFGLSRGVADDVPSDCEDELKRTYTANVGSLGYEAPEVMDAHLNGQRPPAFLQALHIGVLKVPGFYMKAAYGRKVDVWSLGACLYFALSGDDPATHGANFLDRRDFVKEWRRRLQNGEYALDTAPFEAVSAEAKHLIRSMMCVDVDERLSCRLVLNHPWVKWHSEGAPPHHTWRA